MEEKVPEKYSEIARETVREAAEHEDREKHVVRGAKLEVLLAMGAEIVDLNVEQSKSHYFSEVIFRGYHFISFSHAPVPYVVDHRRM